MATVTGLTAARMQEVIDNAIADADVVGNNLILTREDGSIIDAGVVGGVQKVTAFPGDAVTGTLVIRTDLPGAPMYKYVNGSWEQQPRMGAQTMPQVRSNGSAALSIPNLTRTILSFPNVDDFDTDGMHDPAVNNDRITIQTPGLYLVSGFVRWASAAGTRELGLTLNGAIIPGFGQTDPAAAITMDQNLAPRLLRLSAGDYIRLDAWQNSGGAINITDRRLELVWLGGAGQTVDERGVPAVRANKLAAQSIPNGAWTKIAYDVETLDTDSMHDTATNNTRFVAKTSGLYRISGSVEFAAHATGLRYINLVKTAVGGAVTDLFQQAWPGQGTNVVPLLAEALVYLSAGDYVELQVYQSSGAALSVNIGSTNSFSAHLVGTGKTVTPFARVYKTANQSTAHGVEAIISWNAEASDNDGIHDTVTNNSRLICRSAGKYVIAGVIDWNTAAAGYREAVIKKNGSVYLAFDDKLPVSGRTIHNIATIEDLAVGDYVELVAYQNTGGALDVVASYSNFEMVKIGSPDSGGSGLGPAQADMFTVATLPAATTFPNGRIVGVSDAIAGQQARMAMNGAWINLG